MSAAEFFGYLGGVVFLCIFILMLEHLKNGSAIMVRAPLRHGGPWGKLLPCNAV